MNAIRARFDAAPMSRAQVIAVALAVILSALDGYDVLSVTFAAPAIAAGWGIGKAALGIVLSAGLAGMAIGSFLIAPFADVIGRKKIILLSLILMAVGMLLSAFSGSIEALAAWRVLTGLGIGACVAVINPISAEFANARRRPLTVAMMAVGYPVGGVVGGLLASYLLRHHGWPSVFLAGFAAAIILLPIVALMLPESLAFLLARRGEGSLARINVVLARCKQPLLDALPEIPPATRYGYAAIFAPKQIGTTLWMTAVNCLLVATIYYVLSWLPQMVADSGFPASMASLVSVVSSLMGVISGLLLGWLAQRGRVRALTTTMLVGLGLATMIFGVTPPSLPLLFVAAGVCGFFLFAGASGMYITLASSFADEARAAGSGFVIGVGRISSALAPIIAGLLFASGLGRVEVCFFFGALSVLSGIILLTGWRRFRPA